MDKADDSQKPARDHTHDPSTGTTHGVPHGVTLEESTGLPDSGRQTTESHPIHHSQDDSENS